MAVRDLLVSFNGVVIAPLIEERIAQVIDQAEVFFWGRKFYSLAKPFFRLARLF